MNATIRRKLAARMRRIEKRLDKTHLGGACPMISASNIRYEIADRTRAVSAGGIGMIHQMVTQLKLDRAINRSLNVFKIYLPYSESDHALNIAYIGVGRHAPSLRDRGKPAQKRLATTRASA